LLFYQTEVLEVAARPAEAESALREAADVATRKGSLEDVRRAEEKLSALAASEDAAG
jgi:hypothetical protein